MRFHRLPVLCAVAAALAAAGCSSKVETTTAPADNQGAPAKKPAGTKGATTVTMRDIEFKPKDIKVKVGDTVEWINEDSVEHDAVAENREFKSELFGQQGTFKYKVKKAGKIPYVCTVHPGMTGTITAQ